MEAFDVVQTISESTTAAAVTDSLRALVDSVRVSALEAQVDILSHHSETLLNTVHWTLATVGGIAVVLLGYNWFVVRREVDRERDELRKGLEDGLTTLRAEAAAAIKVATSDVDTTVATAIANSTKGALASLEGALAGIRLRLAMHEIADMTQEARYWELKKKYGPMSLHSTARCST